MYFDQITLFFGSMAVIPVAFGIIQLVRCGGRYGKQRDH
jgi:hypothetical protein